MRFIVLIALLALSSACTTSWTPGVTPTSTPVFLRDPIVTYTPSPTRTRVAQFRSTPTMRPAPSAVDSLAKTEKANLWVYIRDGRYLMEVMADPVFDVGRFELAVFVDGENYCNANRIYGDEGPRTLSCGSLERRHTSVRMVSVQTDSMGDLRCERNFQSTDQRSVFACVWR